ncbi:MAG: hypothetical protein M4579_002302 [Chaenotheca gracillima]|nr:MAG: hypothetical protein M4579_002302 [Chaenotheca gracillima]
MSTSTYTQGYHESVTRSHSARTAENEAGFLLPHLTPSMKILDVGCGPGSITSGFCKYVPAGQVTGVDVSSAVVEQARTLASEKEVTNLTFETGNVLEGLKYPDGTFDVVYCHQVLNHLPDPVRAMKEMRRVCSSTGGMVACREGDLPFRWYPAKEGLLLWNEMMKRMVRKGGADPDKGGSAIHAYARLAGFDPAKIQKGASVSVVATEEERRWWGTLHADRVEKSDVGKTFQEVGATEEQLRVIVRALREWAEDVDGWYALLQSEVICRT